MRVRLPLLLSVVLMGAAALSAAAHAPAPAARPAADLILTNGRVFTADPAHPEVESVAILGDRIVAAGTPADIAAWRGPATRLIDAGGRRVVPGFNDAHVHFVSGG